MILHLLHQNRKFDSNSHILLYAFQVMFLQIHLALWTSKKKVMGILWLSTISWMQKYIKGITQYNVNIRHLLPENISSEVAKVILLWLYHVKNAYKLYTLSITFVFCTVTANCEDFFYITLSIFLINYKETETYFCLWKKNLNLRWAIART